jgi:hypothetical protein
MIPYIRWKILGGFRQAFGHIDEQSPMFRQHSSSAYAVPQEEDVPEEVNLQLHKGCMPKDG